MNGITGLRLLHRNSTQGVESENGFTKVAFPKKTTVTSAVLHDALGSRVYRKDTKV